MIRTTLCVFILATTLLDVGCTTSRNDYELGIRLSREGRHEEALRAFDRALKSPPGDSLVHAGRASALRGLGRMSEAREAYAEERRTLALELEQRPDDAQGFFRLGMAYHGSGHHPEAIQAFDRGIELAPDHATAYLFRGISLAYLGRHRAALESFDGVIELDPGSGMAHTNRGWSLANLGRFEEALSTFDRVLEADPRSSDAYFNRGRALAMSGNYQEAVSAFDAAIQIGSRSRGAHRYRGEALEALGRYAEAQRAYYRAAGLGAYGEVIDPLQNNPTLHFLRGRTFAKMGRDKNAVEAFDLAIRLRGDYPEASAARQELLKAMMLKE